jgi:hypothetical protein
MEKNTGKLNLLRITEERETAENIASNGKGILAAKTPGNQKDI